MDIPGYRIERFIAKGGMASVYLAVQESLQRRVALKVLKKFDTPEQAERFLHEGRIIASLNHANIITIYDIGVVGDGHYIAMEYLEGGTLAERIAKGMQLADILDLLEVIGGCLDFVHRKGIVHRDIKPGNVLFLADGTPKLTDFGIAKQLDDDQDLTRAGSIFGSPYYLSPDQADGRPLDGRSDIYALGIVFFEMLTGHKPYAEDSPLETILAHVTQPIPVLPKPFSPYQGLLEGMIAKNPAERFASARELLNRVRELKDSGSKPHPGFAVIRASGVQASRLSRLAASGVQYWRASPITVKAALVSTLLSLAIGAILLPMGRGTPKDFQVEAAIKPVAQGSNEKSEAVSRPEDARVVLDAHEGPSEDPPAQTATIADSLVSRTGPNEALDPAREPEADRIPVVEESPPQFSSTGEPVNKTREMQAEIAFAEEILASETTGTDSAVHPDNDSTEVIDEPSTQEREAQTQIAFAAEKPTLGSSGSEPTMDPPNASAKLIEKWLLAADQALQNYRLTTPPEDNAYAYYQKVLDIDPDHEAANVGIDGIADRYALLARKALNRGNYSRANLYVRRGINVRPEHRELLALRAELAKKRQLAAKRRSRPSRTKPENDGGILGSFKEFKRQFQQDFKKSWGSFF